MSSQTVKRHGENLNARYQVKEAHIESLRYCMFPTIRYSRKGKTMQTAKRSEVARK